MGHCDVRRFAWLPALLLQAFLSDQEVVNVNTNSSDASIDRRSSPAMGTADLKDSPSVVTVNADMYDRETITTEDSHNSSMAHYYGGYGPGPASPSSCVTGSDIPEINTNVDRVIDELTGELGVLKAEVDGVEGGQASLETVTSPDIKYAHGTSTLRNAGDTGEVMDIIENTDESKNAPAAFRALTNDPRLTTSFRDMPAGDMPAAQVYNDPVCSRGVSANIGELSQDTNAKVRSFPETDKANDTKSEAPGDWHQPKYQGHLWSLRFALCRRHSPFRCAEARVHVRMDGI